MTALAFCADVHLGNHKRQGGPKHAGINNRAHFTLGVLKDAAEQASAEGARLMILGDLFDTMRPEPQLIARAKKILPEDTIILKGNHDSASDELGDHALGPLEHDGGPSVIDLPMVFWEKDVEVWAVPFQGGTASEWLPKVLSKLESENSGGSRPAAKTRVLTLHLGVADDDTPFFLRGAHDAITASQLHDLQDTFNIDEVFAGNWHNKQTWTRDKRTIHQLGALVPTGWDNPGMHGYGGLAFTGGGRRTYSVSLPGPRFVDAHWPNTKDLRPGNHRLYVRVFSRQEDRQAAEDWACSARSRKGFEAIEVLPDPKQVSAQVAKAAAGARSATTLNEAVSLYLEETIPEEHREEVAERVRFYLD